MRFKDKTIHGKTAEQIIEEMFDVAKWLDVFNAAGRDIYGDEHKIVTGIIGLGTMSMIASLDDFGKTVEEYAKEKKNTSDLIRGMGIKLEGDGTKPNNPS